MVTQAYLTLPVPDFTNILQANEICSRDYMDYYDCEGKLAFFNVIDPASLEITKEKIQRFRQAMRFFGLDPSLIPAQIISVDHGHANPVLVKHNTVVENKHSSMSAVMSLRADVRQRLKGRLVSVSISRSKLMGTEQEQSEWPKLMNLVKSSYEL